VHGLLRQPGHHKQTVVNNSDQMIKTEQIFILILALTLLSECTDKVKTNISAPNGLWKQIGYGRILELNDTTIKVFDLNDIDCMLTFEEDILDFAEVIGINGDTLTLKHGIDHWKCIRIDKLPANCHGQEHKNNKDPLYNYDVFWQNFKEHYCSFEVKNIDWDIVNEEYRPKINAETTDLELFLLFEEIITMLKDGHIKMSVPESIEDEYSSSIKKVPGKFNKLEEFEISESLALLYVDSLRTFNAGMTRWGMIGKNVGYVQINSMLMQADYNLEEGLSLKEFERPYWVDNVARRKDEIYRQEEAAGMKATFDRVLTEMPNATSFIIDLRFNGGGKDGVAMEIIHNFSSYQGIMAVKYVYEKGQFVNHQNITNTPSSNGFNGPVYLLTSHLTASASELAVLCSLADDQFTRIGTRTEGIFSSTLDKVLPNGWDYEFSNEIYEDLKGFNYEHIGISPDIQIEYSRVTDEFFEKLITDIKAGTDPAIEAALQRIRNR